MTTTVDTETLSSPEAQTLKRLVDTADFFRLPEKISGATQPDRFQYDITIEDNDRRHHVEVGEANVPGTLRPLLDWLMEKVRQG